MTDFIMSEKFGLDWKKYDAKRMNIFIEILAAKGKKAEMDARKNNNQNYGRAGSTF